MNRDVSFSRQKWVRVALTAPLRRGVRFLDWAVRRGMGIQTVLTDADFLFRLAVRPAPYTHCLRDGTLVQAGEPVLELHFWNEHLPPMPPDGPDLAWALAMYRGLRRSLFRFSAWLAQGPRYPECRALYGRALLHWGHRRGAPFLERLGFEVVPVPRPTTWRGRMGRFFVTMYTGWLIWAFNPGSARPHSAWQKDVVDIWMSRRRLQELYPPDRE